MGRVPLSRVRRAARRKLLRTAMETKTSRLSRAMLIGITLIILLVPFGLYYLLYVSSQQAYFIKRTHRSLAQIAGQVASRFDSLQEVISNAGKEDCNGHEDTDPIKALFNPNTLSPFGVQLTFVRNTTQTKPDGEQP